MGAIILFVLATANINHRKRLRLSLTDSRHSLFWADFGHWMVRNNLHKIGVARRAYFDECPPRRACADLSAGSRESLWLHYRRPDQDRRLCRDPEKCRGRSAVQNLFAFLY